MTDGLSLGDLGERRIISQFLRPRYAAASPRFGDDCAVLPFPIGQDVPTGQDSHLVFTTDPCPPPMAALLGFDDLFYRGWLVATINLSDLAAAGAKPLGLVTSLQFPGETPVRQFERLLDGIDTCCAEHETHVLGGNMKESPEVDVTATAVGFCDTPPLTRTGAAPGDIVVILGELGAFWAGVLGVRAGLLQRDASEPLLSNVLMPRPKVRAGLAGRRAGVLTACIDNSDGLYPSFLQLAIASSTRLIIEGDALTYSAGVADIAHELNTDPLRLALGWGDWQLVATCPNEHLDAVAAIARETGTGFFRVGRVEAGCGVDLELRGSSGALVPLDSQRFAPDSWFSTGLDSYVEMLLHAPLQITG
jgi:thiamine-monophosphate kinase